MDDRLHQPYRLELVPGAQQAMQAARQAGASAVALSGAGPGLVAFCREDPQPVIQAMGVAFLQKGIRTRDWSLEVRQEGSLVR
jgi:homoserine kinase